MRPAFLKRASTSKRKVRVFAPKHETCVYADAEREVQTCVSPKQHETRVLQMRISTLKREVRVFAPKRESRVKSAPKRDSHVHTTQREVCVLQQTLPKCEAKTRVQPQMARIKANPKSPHPQGFETSPLNTPATDLRDYLTKKMSVHQITPQCCCK